MSPESTARDLTCPAMHDRGTFALSRAAFDGAAAYGHLLAAAPADRRCPVLLAEHALGSLRPDWDPGPALARVAQCDVAAVLAERYPSGCVFHPDCLAPFGTAFPGLASPTSATALLEPSWDRERLGSGHLAPLGDGVSIHDFPFNRCHVVDR